MDKIGTDMLLYQVIIVMFLLDSIYFDNDIAVVVKEQLPVYCNTLF